MIGIALLAMMQAAASDRLVFVCQDDKGESFSLSVPAVVDEDTDPVPSDYVARSLEVPGQADDIVDDLPHKLELFWSPAGTAQVTLEISGYDVVARTAGYRLRRESPPDTPISWSSFSSGQCLGRRVAGIAGRVPQEGSSE